MASIAKVIQTRRVVSLSSLSHPVVRSVVRLATRGPPSALASTTCEQSAMVSPQTTHRSGPSMSGTTARTATTVRALRCTQDAAGLSMIWDVWHASMAFSLRSSVTKIRGTECASQERTVAWSLLPRAALTFSFPLRWGTDSRLTTARWKAALRGPVQVASTPTFSAVIGSRWSVLPANRAFSLRTCASYTGRTFHSTASSLSLSAPRSAAWRPLLSGALASISSAQSGTA